MDISSLSKQLNISVRELRDKMAQAGFKVSPRARKIDNNIARQMMEKAESESKPKVSAPKESGPRKINLPSVMAVRDLAATLQVPVVQVIKLLIQNGVMASLNEQIDFDAAAVVAAELGFDPSETHESGSAVGTVVEILAAEEESKLVARPPIVAVMGHVDHGKTKLLDTIRKTNVIDTEAGAITQHIGAYQVEVTLKMEPKSRANEESRGVPRQARDDSARKTRAITFLDTPGHESFAAMRARGANVTDIIVLVVAADDGVKPQTLEVINRAKMTKTPLIVAINKIDKPDANQELVKKQLAEAGIMPEEWGGKNIFVPISAKQNMGVDKLLDMILLTAEVENFRANPGGRTVGTVIEANLSKTQGPVATVVVQNGTLKVGDVVSVGSAYGRVRALTDENRKNKKQVGPSEPARLIGLSDLPEVGDLLFKHETSQEAQTQARRLQTERSAKRLAYKTGIAMSPEDQQLKIIVKADTNGSLEAIQQELNKLENEDVTITVVSQGIGDINESDVQAAESGGATLIGFHNKVLPAAAKLAKQKHVNIDIYDIIYELTEDITKAILQLIIPEVEQIIIGKAKVLAVFRTERSSMIIGGVVQQGKLVAERKLQIERGGQVLGKGKIEELQQNKLPAHEVTENNEFGMKISTNTKIQKGDILKFVEERMKEKRLKKKA